LGDDPNAEHPQLAKLAIAGAIELFGDGPFAWRIGSVVLGSLAILGMYALVRAAGGGPWTALGASALMAADNLLLVHGRIGTLDIYAVTAMIWAAVTYLRGRPAAAGVLVGVGACTKLVAPYVVVAFVLLELLRGRSAGVRAALRRLLVCVAVAVGVFVGLLAILDQIAPPYDSGHGVLVGGGVFGHISHILSFSAEQTSPRGATGIQSYPWQWLADFRPIVYLNVNPSQPAPGLRHVRPPVHFLGMISPPILLAALIGLVMAIRHLWGVRGSGRRSAARLPDELPEVAIAWTVGTLAPFELLSAALHRTSYLYYMVIVMPGLYLVAMEVLAALRRHRRLLALWAAALIVTAVFLYPFTPLP
jgi:4-amino-4-deoxy-L-arabinose transferase-like glycosyltransferase